MLKKITVETALKAELDGHLGYDDKQVINQSIYLALGVYLEGHKELLGMWLSENECAKFWLGVLT